jgi:Flp pilus assembly protein TadG
MLIRLRQLLRRDRGQEGSAAVEFAVLLPILLILLAGFFDFGWYFYVKHTVTNASREGARYSIQAKWVNGIATPYTDAEITTLLKKNYGADILVDVDRTGGTASGDPRSVTVTKPVQYFFLSFLQERGVNLPAAVPNTTTMTVEGRGSP